MSRHNRRLAAFLVVAASLALVFAGCKTAPDEPDESVEPTGPFAELQKMVAKSDEVPGWKRTGPMTILTGADYTPPNVPGDVPPNEPLAQSAALKDQAAIMAEYKQQVSVLQRFKSSEDDEAAGRIVLEIHEMNAADDAYGLISVTESGTKVDGRWSLGLKSPGRMAFAHDRYAVRVRSGMSTGVAAPPVADQDLMTVARAVAAKLGGRLGVPWVVEKLPLTNQVAGTVVFVQGAKGLALAAEKFATPSMTALLSPVLGNAPMAAATYKPIGGKGNTVFIINRRMARTMQPLTPLDAAMASATPELLNTFVYMTADNGYVVIGSFNAEEESVQRVVAMIAEGMSP